MKIKVLKIVIIVLGLIITTHSKSAGQSDLVNRLEGIIYNKSFTSIPSKIFRADDYGAIADGKTLNTKSIQTAIDAAHEAGGGIVTLPEGVNVSGALFVKSNVELRIDGGVTLKAINDDSQYPEKWTRIAGIEMDWPAALINVYNQENVRITGDGVIDGNGKYWWDKFWGDPPRTGGMYADYVERDLRWAVDYDCKRVRPVVIYKSKNVQLKNFTVHRAGFWTISITYSSRVHLDGIVIRNNIGGYGPSTDGINIDSSRDVLVENCDVDCNDDNFCLKSGRDSDGLRVNIPTENVVIRNCVTGKGHGLITLGSETSGGMNNIEIYGLKAVGTNNGFVIKSAKIRGGIMRNIWIHDVKMDSVANPFTWELNWKPEYSYPPRPDHIPEAEWPDHWHVLLTPVENPERGIPEFYNMRISDVKVTNAKQGIYANAYHEKPIRNVLFENVLIEAEKGGSINNGKDWEMKNVTLRSKEQIKLKNCNNVQLPSNSKWDDTTQKDWPDQCREVGIPSSLDGETQMAYFYASEKKDRPLVVSLHTWSGNYKQEDELAIQCIEKDYNYVHPDFRGPNNTFKACGSKYVLQDIEDAISFAMENGNVDTKNIHVIGASGGGYATLLTYMNTRHPVKTFSAWVPISDLKKWYYQSEGRGTRYSYDIARATVRGNTFQKDDYYLGVEEAIKRSPVYMQVPLKKRQRSKLSIYTGIHDGYKGSVPISQSLNFFNKVVSNFDSSASSALISQEDIIEMLASRYYVTDSKDTLGSRIVHYHKQYKNLVEITVFEGGHECLTEIALEHLQQQNTKRKNNK